MRNPNMGRCLDVEQSHQTRLSTRAQMWDCYGNAQAQQFRMYTNADNEYRIHAYDDKYCLDVAGGDSKHGQEVRWWQCNGSNAQRWVSWTQGRFTFWSPYGHVRRLCLDPWQGFNDNRNGQPIKLSRCHGGPEQDFQTSVWPGRGGVWHDAAGGRIVHELRTPPGVSPSPMEQ
ncbi:ricin B lectin domain-containing protein [Catenaria anguillulae PL171]|uniref:Ricin B lectin domain-containing protein n=1 Tax=Catenaria anguillulae PL171 TaxID=765915 RepID=A0A1Y2H9J8_9FUNG|nr:ricin B lectin domain-containing protein [Catenaria anguillulae PL171]